MNEISDINDLKTFHRFLDEAGDTTFYGKGKKPIIGQPGVSNTFIIGMVKYKQPLEEIRKSIRHLQTTITKDPYYRQVQSIQKKIQLKGFYFHASEDPPEVRKTFYEFIRTIDCSFEAVVGRKILEYYEKKHNGRESEFYADILSHLLKNKLEMGDRLILNIAERGRTTRNTILQKALEKATRRFLSKRKDKEVLTKVIFNVQNHCSEPLLNIADYFCWAVQRVFERGEIRYYEFLLDKISLVVDLYDTSRYDNSRNYYTKENPLSAQNKIGPRLH